MSFLKYKDSQKNLYSHIADLRKFFIINFLIYISILGLCIYFSSDIYKFLTLSLASSLDKYNLKPNFIVTSLTEMFSVYLKTAFICSFIIFLPFFIIAIIVFIFPALKKLERKIIISIGILIPILFYSGIAFAYLLSLGKVWDFFIKVSMIDKDVELLVSTISYLNLVLKIMLAFGISFELPTLLILLCLMKVINKSDIIKYSRYAIVLAFIIGALITPPDPISQILVAGVLLVLYYLSYFVIKILKI